MATKTTQAQVAAAELQGELLATDKTTAPAALAGDRVYVVLDQNTATALRLVREQPRRYLGADERAPSKGRALAYILGIGASAILTVHKTG